MQERFLFDRVKVQRAGIAVGQRVEFAVLVHPIAAVTPVLGLQQAFVGTEFALDVLAQFQVVPRLPHPALLLPQLPKFAARAHRAEKRRPSRPIGSGSAT